MAEPAPIVSLDDPAVADRVAAALVAGGVVVLPTDTVYGVAALPHDRWAVDRLFAMKGRQPDIPIAVLCADADQALALAVPEAASAVRPVAERWWPGPLTVVLPRRVGLGLHLGEPATTIGVRVPAHDLVGTVAAAVGPLATTSANRHGSPTPTRAAEAAASLGPGLALVVDGGPLRASASTVVDATGDAWRILREGAITAADLAAVAPRRAPLD